jgi:hypothetical protein
MAIEEVNDKLYMIDNKYRIEYLEEEKGWYVSERSHYGPYFESVALFYTKDTAMSWTIGRAGESHTVDLLRSWLKTNLKEKE